jgi:DNA-binding transcriptional MerR regulator
VTQRTYKLDELARAAGTSPRTIRYYVQRGLLPAPQFRGKDTAYDHDHLVRLKAIRKLQEAYLPLDAVAAELERRTPEEIERLAEGKDPIPTPRAPAPEPRRRTPALPPRGRSWTRFEVAPGIELSIADDASPRAQREFERALLILQTTMPALDEGESR